MDRTPSYLHRVSPSLGRPSDAPNNQQRPSNMALNNPYGLTPQNDCGAQIERLVEGRYNRLNGLSSPQRPQQPQMEPQPTEPRASQRGPLAQTTPDGRGIQPRSLNPGSVRILQRPSKNESSDLRPFLQPAQQAAQQATQRLNQQLFQQPQQQPATRPQQTPLSAPPSREARPAAELLPAVKIRRASLARSARPGPQARPASAAPLRPAAEISQTPTARPASVTPVARPARPARPAVELPPTPAMSSPPLPSPVAPAPASTNKTSLIIVYQGRYVLVAKPPTLIDLKRFVVGFFGIDINTYNLRDLRPFVSFPHPLNGMAIEVEIHESGYDSLKDREQVLFAFWREGESAPGLESEACYQRDGRDRVARPSQSRGGAPAGGPVGGPAGGHSGGRPGGGSSGRSSGVPSWGIWNCL